MFGVRPLGYDVKGRNDLATDAKSHHVMGENFSLASVSERTITNVILHRQTYETTHGNRHTQTKTKRHWQNVRRQNLVGVACEQDLEYFAVLF